MTGSNSIIFSLALGFFAIGTHQALIYSIADAYGIFMLSLGLLFLYGYRKKRMQQEEQKAEPKKKNSKRK